LTLTLGPSLQVGIRFIDSVSHIQSVENNSDMPADLNTLVQILD